MKIIAAGANPVQITRGIDRTVGALVKDLEGLSTEVDSNDDLCNVATVSAGGNELVGQLIRDAMEKVGRKGVITLEESRTAEDSSLHWGAADILTAFSDKASSATQPSSGRRRKY